ncbi:MAG: hypothetical protein V4608_09380 [Bacteroidota bacterium]
MLRNKKSLVAKGALVIAVAMLMAACGNEMHSESNKDQTKTPTIAEASITPNETQQPTYTLPSPLEIASIFKKSGMKFKEGLTSQAKDPSRYTTNFSKALNLGVYSADLSYAILNKQNQEVMNYMKLSRKISDHLGIGSVYETNNLAKRFEKNIANEDSLGGIISELQMEMDFYLMENNLQQITSIAFAGAWIESLYIATKVYENTKEKELNKKLSQQISILGSIVNALKEEEKKDQAITGLISQLQDVQMIYNSFKTVKDSSKSKNKIILTDGEVALLTEKIIELRTKFINGQKLI